MDPDAGFDARLHADGVAFDDRDAELLRAVDEAGSLNAAASDLGRSYSRVHERVSDLEAAFGPLVERRRGGREGGGSELTAGARDLLTRFERLRSGFAGVADVDETVLAGSVVDRDGELATVEAAPGSIRAIAPPGMTEVAVTVRADAVTLHATDEAPSPGATSARNRFEGHVRSVETGQSVARVRVTVAEGTDLVALVTIDSVDRLSLDEGDPVVCSFKATATRAVPRTE